MQNTRAFTSLHASAVFFTNSQRNKMGMSHGKTSPRNTRGAEMHCTQLRYQHGNAKSKHRPHKLVSEALLTFAQQRSAGGSAEDALCHGALTLRPPAPALVIISFCRVALYGCWNSSLLFGVCLLMPLLGIQHIQPFPGPSVSPALPILSRGYAQITDFAWDAANNGCPQEFTFCYGVPRCEIAPGCIKRG